MIIVTLFSRFRPSPPKYKCQSSKKRVFLRRYTPKIESVEEPTENPAKTQDSDQEDSSQEDSAQDNLVQEESAQEDSGQKDTAQEAPTEDDTAQENSDQEDTAQQPADAEDSLEAEVDFLVHLPLELPLQLAAKKSCSCQSAFLLPFCPVP